MKNKGWVKLWRNQYTNWVSERKPWCDGYAWCYLYSQANHKEGIVNFRNEYLKVKRGEFITSKLKLQKTFGWTYKRVNSFLTALETDEMITTKTTNRFIRIFVINYEKYQSTEEEKIEQKDEQKPNRSRTELERGNTNKNVKNVKNVNTSKEVLRKLTQYYINSNKRKDIRIILLYARAKGKQEWSSAEEKSFIKRNLRAAKLLEPYSYEKIIEVMEWLNKHADFKWTLESVNKYIDEDLSSLTKKINKDDDYEIPSVAKEWIK